LGVKIHIFFKSSYNYEHKSWQIYGLQMPTQLSILEYPESSLFTVPLKNSTMENIKQMELEVLIAIRNNPKTHVDEFYKIFECCWPEYRTLMGDLYNKGLFIISRHELIRELNRLELTDMGKRRETELLLERSNALSKILSAPKKAKKPRTAVQMLDSLKLSQA
jgi:hypothetical protein